MPWSTCAMAARSGWRSTARGARFSAFQWRPSRAWQSAIEPEVKAQEAGDRSAAHAAPGPTGNRDRSDMGYHAFGPASDGERQVACPEIATRTRRGWGEILAVGDPEHRHVRQRRPDAPPIRNGDRDILICFQGFLGGDDGAATPDKTASPGVQTPTRQAGSGRFRLR